MNYGLTLAWGQTDRHAHRQTDTHINTVIPPCLGAGPSENYDTTLIANSAKFLATQSVHPFIVELFQDPKLAAVPSQSEELVS